MLVVGPSARDKYWYQYQCHVAISNDQQINQWHTLGKLWTATIHQNYCTDSIKVVTAQAYTWGDGQQQWDTNGGSAIDSFCCQKQQWQMLQQPHDWRTISKQNATINQGTRTKSIETTGDASSSCSAMLGK